MVDDIRDQRLSRLDSDDNEPLFVPPEKVAETEEIIDMSKQSKPPSKTPNKKKSLKTRLKQVAASIKVWWKKLSKKQKIAVAVAAALLLALSGFGLYKVFSSSPPPPPVAKKEEPKQPPKPTTEA